MNNILSFVVVFLLVGAGWYLLETVRSRAKGSSGERAKESGDSNDS